MKNPLRFSVGSRIRDKYILSLLKPQAEEKFLEIGCGIGYNCELVSQYSTNVSGVDLDADAIQYAKELYPTFSFSVKDATDLPYESNSFDKIICSEVLEHIEDDKQVINEIYRVLKPNGHVLLTIPCPDGVFGSKIKDIGHSHDGLEKHFRDGYTIDDLRRLLEPRFECLNHQYTMTFLIEMYMGLTKLMYLKKSKGDFHGQSKLRLLQEKSISVRINKMLLPIVLRLGYLEDKLLSGWLKGHMLISVWKKTP